MNFANQIANQFREVQLNGTWIATNYKKELATVTWEQAVTKIANLNTIADLTFHINYYTAGVLQVLEGGTLDIRDKYSFDYPPIESPADWEKLRAKAEQDAERFAKALEKLSDEVLQTGFVKDIYGTYFRNMTGMIEHSYYHLGQIVLLKKLIAVQAEAS
ncbi:MAG: DinB family protein [Bacteroidota bacterium]